MSDFLAHDHDVLKWGTHQPLLVAAVAVASPGLPILELGTGRFSTPLLSTLCGAMGRRLVSADTEETWLERLRPLAMGPHHEFVHVTDWDEAVDRCARETWGVVLVDHWPQERRGRDLARLADCGQLFVLHDSQDETIGYDWSGFPYVVHDVRFTPRTTAVSRLWALPGTP